MNAAQRRSTILSLLSESAHPISASALAQHCGVTRQVIVGDIALLRVGGTDISATARGYVLAQADNGLLRRLACRHSAADTAAELNTIVDCGCTAVDVSVEHPIYGEITCSLGLSSRYDVEQFVQRMNSAEALPLSSLTEGVHLHTVLCPDEDRFARLKEKLAAEGFLVEDRD